MALIYKIVTSDVWQGAQAAGQLTGMPVDLADGYIHFSSASQLRETAARHFAGQAGLVLLGVEADRLGTALTWEPSRGGALFPHLYAPLTIDLVSLAVPLPMNAAGAHLFPEGIP